MDSKQETPFFLSLKTNPENKVNSTQDYNQGRLGKAGLPSGAGSLEKLRETKETKLVLWGAGVQPQSSSGALPQSGSEWKGLPTHTTHTTRAPRTHHAHRAHRTHHAHRTHRAHRAHTVHRQGRHCHRLCFCFLTRSWPVLQGRETKHIFNGKFYFLKIVKVIY